MRCHEADDASAHVAHGEHGHAVQGGGEVGHVAVHLVDHRLARTQGRFLAVDVHAPEAARVKVLGTAADDGRGVGKIHQFQGTAVLEVDVAPRVLYRDAGLGEGCRELHEHLQVRATCLEESVTSARRLVWRQRRQIVSLEICRVHARIVPKPDRIVRG